MDNNSFACAERIALLSILRPVVEKPRRSELWQTGNTNSSHYDLPPASEYALVSSLAYLASTSEKKRNYDQPCKRIQDDRLVASVAVEENSKRALDVWVAVNRKSENDGEDHMARLGVRFTAVFETVANITERTTIDYSADVILQCIVENWWARILMIMGLDNFSDRLRKFASHLGRPSPEIVSFERTYGGLLAELRCGPSASGMVEPTNLDLLKQLVQALHVVDQALAEAGSLVSDGVMVPDTNQELRRRIHRVGSYVVVARSLALLASRHARVKKMRFRPVKLWGGAFKRTPKRRADLEQILTQVCTSGGVPSWSASRLVAHVQNAPGQRQYDTIQEMYDGRVDESLTKVMHAEVQLALFLAFQPDLYPAARSNPRPRVIRSTKKACFLCWHFLLRLDGAPRLPTTHGRLYHEWRLPTLPALPATGDGLRQLVTERQRELTFMLESAIRQTLLAWRIGRIPVLPSPLEADTVSLFDDGMSDDGRGGALLWSLPVVVDTVPVFHGAMVKDDRGQLSPPSPPSPPSLFEVRAMAVFAAEMGERGRGAERPVMDVADDGSELPLVDETSPLLDSKGGRSSWRMKLALLIGGLCVLGVYRRRRRA